MPRNRIRRVALVSAAAALALSVVPQASAAPLPCGLVPGPLRTLHVEIKALTKKVKIGKLAKFEVLVTRPAHEDPLHQGVDTGEPPTSQPAEDVGLSFGVLTGEAETSQNVASLTGKNGKATITIKLADYSIPGPAEVRVHALKTHFKPDGQCVELQEDGYGSKENLFKVKR